MMTGDPRASGVFEKDVEDTYAHLCERVRISKAEAEAAGEQEQIQLVPENPDSTIGFNVPDGPPPEHLELEGPGFEGVSVEDVRRALQMRWDVFSGFDADMQAALKSGALEEVNKVLGRMRVEQAEEVVKLLDVAGILSFSSSGIRDDTGRDEGDEADDEEDEDDTEETEAEAEAEAAATPAAAAAPASGSKADDVD